MSLLTRLGSVLGTVIRVAGAAQTQHYHAVAGAAERAAPAACVRVAGAAHTQHYHAVAGVAERAAPAAALALTIPAASRLLAPPAASTQVLPSRGMKMKGRIRRRCKHCYIVARHGRWYVMCPVHPRHKQMSLVAHPKSTWVLSDAMQTPRRPW